MLKRLFKKLKLDNNFFEDHLKKEVWLAIEHNPTPRAGQIIHNLVFESKDNKSSLSLNSQTNKLIVDYFQNSRSLQKIFEGKERFLQTQKLINFKHQLIKKQIDYSITIMAELKPNPQDYEAKLLEWTRVSFEVLKKALTSIDHINTLLQYKLFWGERNGVFAARLIIYNLDISYRFLNEGIEIVIIDNEKLVQRGIVKGHYNELFNHFIELLNTIKQKENESFGLDYKF